MAELENILTLNLQGDEFMITSSDDEQNILRCARAIIQQHYEHSDEPFTNVIPIRPEYFGKPLTSTDSTEDIRAFLNTRFQDDKKNTINGLYLSEDHRVIALEHLAFGSLGKTIVTAQEIHDIEHDIIRTAYKTDSAFLILIQNRPLESAQPILIDVSLTITMQEIFRFLKLELLDHYIIGNDGIQSLADKGFIKTNS